MIKSIDVMKLTQDRATNPPSDTDKNHYAQTVKSLGAEYMAISTPYDTPSGGPDATAVTTAWVNAIRANGLKVWHRHSWLSDEGWYGVPKNTTNDRIDDTKNWILAHADLFKEGDIFCPKPEPQNMGVYGINGNGDRFKSVAAFNLWLQDMTKACKEAFTQLGLNVKVGYWGFDGFVVCGYNNPDWTGRTFLEPLTVQSMDNIVCTDHYPSLVGKPMSDFINVFKKALPGAKLFIGENGSAAGGDTAAQFTSDYNACLADSVCVGYNYWQLGPDGSSEKLINSDFSLTAVGNKVKELWLNEPTTSSTTNSSTTSSTTSNSSSSSTSSSSITTSHEEPEKIISAEGLSTIVVVTNKGNLWKYYNKVWTKLPLPNF